jgi:hypothetical protein
LDFFRHKNIIKTIKPCYIQDGTEIHKISYALKDAIMIYQPPSDCCKSYGETVSKKMENAKDYDGVRES